MNDIKEEVTAMNSAISTQKVVTRFAPSPTGFMHVGNVRTALFTYLWARKNNGTFILRIEDTDKAREVAGSIEHMKESLKWIGLSWDEGDDVGGPHGPYTQSLRGEIYARYAQRLVDAGFAYVDPYTEEEIEALRQSAEAEKKQFLYRDHRKEDVSIPWTGVGQTLRFKIQELKRYAWHDVVFGDLSAGEEALDDFVLIKKDGYATYNFAHVVDDIEMGITHVMRGQEYVPSTPKYLALYEALGVTPPVFVSLPHVLADSGKKKLGKRDGVKDILEYRKEGYLGEAMFNFLAFLGFNPGGEAELYTKETLADVFDISRIQHSGARFNTEKLDWYNKEYLKKLADEDFYTQALPYIPTAYRDESILKKILHLVRDRASTFGEVAQLFENGEFEYMYTDPLFDESPLSKEMLIWKQLKESEERYSKTREILAEVKSRLSTCTDWTCEGVKNTLWDYAEKEGRGYVLWPLRVALCGKEKSPDPFELATLLGKEKVLTRIENGISVLGE